MRKSLLFLAFVIAGTAAFGAFGPHAFADQVQCSKTNPTESHLSSIRSDCLSNCDDTKKKAFHEDIDGCKKSCRTFYDTCLSKYNEWDKKKAECRKPITACWDACPKGADNQKCKDKCSDKLADELGKCSERAMQ
jgi:hypothetical protein